MEGVVSIIFLIFILGFVIFCVYNERYKEVQERNKKRKKKIQDAFSYISTGDDFFRIKAKFEDLEGVIGYNLESEEKVNNEVIRKIYVWNLDWNYVVSEHSGIGVVPVNMTSYSNKGTTFTNGYSTSIINYRNTNKAFLRMVFENNKLVFKEQKGLYE